MPNTAATAFTENKTECSKGCTYEKLHNSICDMECNNAICGYDNNNCPCDDDGLCLVHEVGDGICHPKCHNDNKCTACPFGELNCSEKDKRPDGGDCECAPGCVKAQFGGNQGDGNPDAAYRSHFDVEKSYDQKIGQIMLNLQFVKS